jgi:protein-tyrosine-phosphatase
MTRTIAALLVAVACAAAAPAAAAQSSVNAQQVLFICPHGAAKSVMASAYFQKLAKERGLNVRVDAAGTEPEPQLSTSVVARLKKNGYAVPIDKPRAATAADMKRADIVVSMGSDLSRLPAPRGTLKNWNVPDFSANFDVAEQAIRDQVTQLVGELVAAQKARK